MRALAATALLALGAASLPAVAATPPAPDDEDAVQPGVQVTVPYYSEPEFVLLAGNERWNVRNRPAGTVAAGYGHTDDAIHDALMATGRYEPMPSTGSGAPLDVAVLSPGEGRR